MESNLQRKTLKGGKELNLKELNLKDLDLPSSEYQNPNRYHISAFYLFRRQSLDVLSQRHSTLKELLAQTQLRGLFIYGPEGCNGTLSGPTRGIDFFKTQVSQVLCATTEEFNFKDTYCDYQPFEHLKVQMRDEIVTIGDTENYPHDNINNTYLDSIQWNQYLKTEDIICLDVRNWYETQLGKFKHALDLSLDEFREFPEAFRAFKDSGISQDKTILTYCTGGIRCEKAVVELKNQGFKNVFQLKGGILAYLKEFPDQSFEGECFVFDNRVALDNHLRPSKQYVLCPHCGQPGNVPTLCQACHKATKVCYKCFDVKPTRQTCSKSCRYQISRAQS